MRISTQLVTMPLQSINLAELDAVYEFVEAAIPKTGLILHDDALFRPWVRAVVASVPEVAWFCPSAPLSGESIRHLCNFAHSSLVEKGFVLIEAGRVVSVIDVEAVGGLSEPHRLADVVRRAFEFRKRATQGDNGQSPLVQSEGSPYLLLGAQSAEEEIRTAFGLH